MVFDRKKWAGICRCTAGSPLLGWPGSLDSMRRLCCCISPSVTSPCVKSHGRTLETSALKFESPNLFHPQNPKKIPYCFGLFRILLSNVLGELFPRKPGSEIRDLEDPVLITLRPSTATSGPLETWTCVFWNETEKQWSTEGAGPGPASQIFPVKSMEWESHLCINWQTWV